MNVDVRIRMRGSKMLESEGFAIGLQLVTLGEGQLKDVHTLVVEATTWRGKEKGEESIARGQAEAKKLAADF